MLSPHRAGLSGSLVCAQAAELGSPRGNVERSGLIAEGVPMNVASLRVAAAVLTMASGWVLVLAGYVAYSSSVAAGALISLPSGPIIVAGLATAARADQAAGDTVVAV